MPPQPNLPVPPTSGAPANRLRVVQCNILHGGWPYEVRGRKLFAITFGGRARHSGIEVELHPFHVFRRRDGRTVRWQIFQKREEALEAVGLRE